MDDEKDSRKTSEKGIDIDKQWKKYGEMSLEEKRQLYKCGNGYVELKDIPTWTQYFNEQTYYFHKISTSGKPCKRPYEFNSKLNNKVSLWKGDITTLEIDAIVNAANSTLLGGGGVDGCIHRAAGPTLVKECYLLHGCETGDAKITSGHKLPAKFVLHTVGPMGKKEDQLKSCYKTCLTRCLEHRIKSVALCCISTGIYGYPNHDAADVALRTTREWLEKNADAVDRIIFCLFLPKDIDIYHSLMVKYFPPREESDIKDSEKKRRNTKQQQQKEGKEEVTIEDKTEDHVPEHTVKKHKLTEGEGETTENPVCIEESMETNESSPVGQQESPMETEEQISDKDETVLQDPDKDETALQNPDKDETALQDPDKDETGLQDSDKDETGLQDPDKDETALQDPDKDETVLQDPDKDETVLQDPDKDTTALEDPDKDTTALEDPDKDTTALQDPDKDTTALETVKEDPENIVVEQIDDKNTDRVIQSRI